MFKITVRAFISVIAGFLFGGIALAFDAQVTLSTQDASRLTTHELADRLLPPNHEEIAVVVRPTGLGATQELRRLTLIGVPRYDPETATCIATAHAVELAPTDQTFRLPAESRMAAVKTSTTNLFKALTPLSDNKAARDGDCRSSNVLGFFAYEGSIVFSASLNAAFDVLKNSLNGRLLCTTKQPDSEACDQYSSVKASSENISSLREFQDPAHNGLLCLEIRLSPDGVDKGAANIVLACGYTFQSTRLITSKNRFKVTSRIATLVLE